MIRRLAERFFIASDKRDQIEEEYAHYQTVDFPSDIQMSAPVDIFRGKNWKNRIKYRKDFGVCCQTLPSVYCVFLIKNVLLIL